MVPPAVSESDTSALLIAQAEGLWQAGQPDQAITLLGQTIDRRGTAGLAPVFGAMALAAGRGDALVGLAHHLATRTDFVGAADLLNQLIAADPGNAEARAQRGNWLAEAGAVPAALAEYRAALALKPALAGAWGNLANQLVRWRRDPAAARPAEHAVRLDPGAARAWADWGRALRLAGRLQDAAAALSTALSLAPELDYAVHHSIETLAELGRIDEALSLLDRSRTLAERQGMARLGQLDRATAFIVLDPGLIGLGGHRYNFAQAIADAAQSLGRTCAIVANRQWPGLPAPFTVVPALVAWPHGGGDTDRSNDFFRAQLTSLPAGWVKHDDVLFFHTPSAALVRGFADWLSELPAATRPVLALNFMIPDFLDGTTGGLAAAALYYQRLFALIDPARAILSVETPGHKALLEDLSGGRLTFEVRAPLRLERTWRALDPNRRPLVVAHLGQSRPERGTHFLPEIAAMVRPARPISWLVQLNRTNLRQWAGRFAADFAVDADRLLPALAALERRGDVELLGDELPSADYYAALDRTDILLLPYAARYTQSGSGVFREGLAAGKVIVGPAGSSLAEEALRRGGGYVGFAEFSPTAIAQAVDEAIAAFPRLCESARAAAAAVGADHDQTRYFKRLVVLAES